MKHEGNHWESPLRQGLCHNTSEGSPQTFQQNLRTSTRKLTFTHNASELPQNFLQQSRAREGPAVGLTAPSGCISSTVQAPETTGAPPRTQGALPILCPATWQSCWMCNQRVHEVGYHRVRSGAQGKKRPRWRTQIKTASHPAPPKPLLSRLKAAVLQCREPFGGNVGWLQEKDSALLLEQLLAIPPTALSLPSMFRAPKMQEENL